MNMKTLLGAGGMILSLVLGVGANELIGGAVQSIALQPLSIEA